MSPAVTATATGLNRLIDALPSIVDRRVGIVQSVGEIVREPGTPEFFHYYARACDTSAFTRLENFRDTGGASSDRGIAMAKAIGEAVERYCSAIFHYEDLPLTPFNEADFACIEPERFALYRPQDYEQPGFMWVPFERETPVRWTPALDPLTGETVHVPAAFVFVPYMYYQETPDAPIVQPISTGLACHCSPAEAAVSGICEVIERDAFTITWQAMLAPPQILVETLDDANYDLVERFERAGGRVTMFNLTMDHGIPTILSVLQYASPAGPALSFAASTSPSRREAARKSLEELAHTRRYAQHIKTYLPRVIPSPPLHENIVDQTGHLGFWADHDNRTLADFLFASKERQEFDEVPDVGSDNPMSDFETLCRRIDGVGHRVLLAELTTPDVADLGLTVLRCVVPGFHPLFMGYQNRATGGTRLWEVPGRIGLKGITPETGDNPSPHPYP